MMSSSRLPNVILIVADRHPDCRATIDVYIWLAYRLHALKRDVEIGWPSLHAQFGAGYTRLRAFRSHFLEALNLACAVYPEANISVGERGIILRPSRPAIAKT